MFSDTNVVLDNGLYDGPFRQGQPAIPGANGPACLDVISSVAAGICDEYDFVADQLRSPASWVI